MEPVVLPLPPLVQIKQIAAGNEFTAILTSEGKLFTFGFNGSGQLGLGINTSVHCPNQLNLTINVASLAAANGCEHLILITKDGAAYITGYNNYGQLGINSQTNVNAPVCIQELKDYYVTSAACSYYHSVFIAKQCRPTSDDVGTYTFSCGRNENGQVINLCN